MIGFSFEDDGFSIETFIEQDLVWCEVFETDISKDESVVDVSNMFDEQVVLERICLKLMDQICSLMEITIQQSAGDKGLPIGLPRR